MRADIDRLMQERELDAILIYVDHMYSPPLDYLVGTARITGGLAIKRPGQDPILYCNPMETEEAAVTGLQVLSYNEVGWPDILKESKGDPAKGQTMLWQNCLNHAQVGGGRIGVYGTGNFNTVLLVTQRLQEQNPAYKFVGDIGRTLFYEAATTKDPDEIERIKSVARRTSDVLQATWDYIGGHKAGDDETVINGDGQPLTIGDVKRFIRRALLERDLEDTGMIFAQGRDAGFPHSRGQESMPLKLGQSIVFDLFPREFGGGYFHDTTRTWCIGYAPDEVQAAYDTVMHAFEIAIEAYGLEKPTRTMQEAVQDYFEAQGHPTARSEPGTTIGYMHSLGHGIGLNIHERPGISHRSQDDEVFRVGNVITIEPGLYYPEAGYGVRVEDALYIDEQGELVTLTDFRKDLVLPLNG